jgi:hypothetical protein
MTAIQVYVAIDGTDVPAGTLIAQMAPAFEPR